MVARDKEVQEWNEQKLPNVLPGYSGGRLPGRSTEERGREEEEEEEDCKERPVKNEIAQGVVASIKKNACVHEDAKPTSQKGGRGLEQVQGGRQQKRNILRWRCGSGMEAATKKQEISNTQMV